MALPTGLPSGNGSLSTLKDGRAFDQCFVCGLAMCEECDYMEDVDMEADEGAPSPDPRTVTMCEDCIMWWQMGDPFEDYEEDF